MERTSRSKWRGHLGASGDWPGKAEGSGAVGTADRRHAGAELSGLSKVSILVNTNEPFAFCNFSAAAEIDAEGWAVYLKHVHNFSQLVGRLRCPSNSETL